MADKTEKPKPSFRNPKSGMSAFSTKGVKKPVRASYYGKKARSGREKPEYFYSGF